VTTNHLRSGKPELVPAHTVKEIDMALDNEQIIRQADQTAGRVTR
jgi:hypothetical protein